MIDNFKQILDLMSFNNKNEFYFIQIIQRKKDDNDVRSSSGYRLIKSFYVYSKEELIDIEPRIIELCKQNNARAYINLNVRNSKEIMLHCIHEYTELLMLDQCSNASSRMWDHCCGKYPAKGYKQLWIVDVDDSDIINKVEDIINLCGEECIVSKIPTKSGIHIICKGFNKHYFTQLCHINEITDVNIKTNSPTLLYYDPRSI